MQNTKHLSRDRFTISTTWRQTIHYCGCTPVSACIHECTHTEHFIRASGIHFSSVNVTTIPRIEWRPLSLLIILSTTCIMFPRVTSCVTIVHEFTYLWYFFLFFSFFFFYHFFPPLPFFFLSTSTELPLSMSLNVTLLPRDFFPFHGCHSSPVVAQATAGFHGVIVSLVRESV